MFNPPETFAEGVYTGLINLLPDSFPLPAAGIINIIYGDYGAVELGGINVVEGDLVGAQAGLINIVDQNMKGTQIGIFFNANNENMEGAQIGIVNINTGNANGLQAGFYNKTNGIFSGIQAGGFNFTEDDNTTGMQFGITNAGYDNFKGMQFGVVNRLDDGLVGAQTGAVNYAESLDGGAQIGGFNIINGSLGGVQLGLFNYAESVDYGAPIGILSIVRDDGYFALETSFSNLATDIRMISGLEYLYSSLSLAVSMPEISAFATFGLGSTIHLFGNFFGDFLCLIPEIRFTTPLFMPVGILHPETAASVFELMENGIFPFSLTCAAKIGFSFGGRILVSAGPVFGIDNDSKYVFSNFPFSAKNIGGDSRFIFGFEASLRWILSD